MGDSGLIDRKKGPLSPIVGSDVRLIVGLGNPGETYAKNRHNLGFMVMDELAKRASAAFKPHPTQALISECRLDAVRVVLAKPMSYMNLSGEPVAALQRYFKVPIHQVIVVHDDLDLPFGTIRVKSGVKRGSGDGGHNGLRSITKALSTADFLRVRVGIGRPSGESDAKDHKNPDAKDYVLSNFSRAEKAELADIIDQAADAAEALLAHDVAKVQNTFHARKGPALSPAHPPRPQNPPLSP